jgi:protein-L-isoaspartate(D-aspartate) O-methyltransferase
MEWPRPRFDERERQRHAMVERSLKANGITDSATLEAMRHVPRHMFVPRLMRGFAYQNTALSIRHGQTISQPFVVAYMTQLLNLKPGDKVLEIGTGSGYQAAVLSELTPYVYTVEIVEELAKETQTLLEELGYSTIKTKIGDGYQGWKEHAPFDAIILTAAADEIPVPLVEQLKPTGVMVMPVGEPGATQQLVKITKNADGTVQKEDLLPVRFVPMTGKALDGK